MQEVVRDGMRAGAIGFATSFAPTHRGMDGKPIPSRFAERSELEALLEVLSELDTGIVGVTPGEGCSDADLYDLALRTGRPFTYGAILTRPDGLHADAIKLNDEGWRWGAQVWPQVTPRPLVLANTLVRPYIFNMHPVLNELMTGSLSQRRAAYEDPAWREKARTGLESMGFNRAFWSKVLVDDTSVHPELVGRSLADLAAEHDVEPCDVMLDLALDEPALELRVLLILTGDGGRRVNNAPVVYYAGREEACPVPLRSHVVACCSDRVAGAYLPTGAVPRRPRSGIL